MCTFVGDELEAIINGVRNEVKSAGQQDTRENCWSFFIDRVRKQLKVSFRPISVAWNSSCMTFIYTKCTQCVHQGRLTHSMHASKKLSVM